MYKIYVTHTKEDFCDPSKIHLIRNPQIECLILADQNIKYEVIHDRTTAMKLGRGHLNPASDWIIQAPDGELIRSYFELIKNIEKNGCRQI